MQLLEHEAKELARQAGIRTPRGTVAATPAEAAAAAASLGANVAVKAQVAGKNRAADGGIWIGPAPEAQPAAAAMFAKTVCGEPVRSVLVEESVATDSEAYLGVTVSQRHRAPVILFGAAGGSGIERRFAETGTTLPFSPSRPPARREIEPIVRATCGDTAVEPLTSVALATTRLFRQLRAQTVELNPLALVASGAPVALDVRVVPDPATVPPDATTPANFDFLALDRGGTVGVVSTGAGGTMLLIDLLVEHGLRPANFCDMRAGSARGNPARIQLALTMLKPFHRLRCIAINVFAGITDLDEFTTLLIAVLRDDPPAVPVIARLQGRRSDNARARLRSAGYQAVATVDELLAACAEAIG